MLHVLQSTFKSLYGKCESGTGFESQAGWLNGVTGNALRVRHIEIRNFRGIKSFSWSPEGSLNCLIGAGDSCKTTVLTALDYALAPRMSLTIDDSDFFNQDIEHDIVIQVTLADWDENRPEVSAFFSESKFARYKCGLDDDGPHEEPSDGNTVAVSVSLRVDRTLEPKWFIVKGKDEGELSDRKHISGSDRAVFGLSRFDASSGYNFTWGRQTILTRLGGTQANLGSVLSDLTREVRRTDVTAHPAIAACQEVADTVRQKAIGTGVKLSGLAPRIDIQRQALGGGALSLYEENVPLRNKGSGSKKLIATAMQMELNDGKNISVIDEIETGLEPHRIRGLIHQLRASGQQVFTTTHSPVVLRELTVSNKELYVCRRDDDGSVQIGSLAAIPNIQGPVRSNPEAFLGSRIIACEGSTEIGCLRAYDLFRFEQDTPPLWSMDTAYFNCGTASQIKAVCPRLIKLGYRTAALCDNDAQDQLNERDVQRLESEGVHICQWERDHSTETQLFAELPWEHIPALLALISDNHDTRELPTIIDSIKTKAVSAGFNLSRDPHQWPEDYALRSIMGGLARDQSWIKRIDYAEKAFSWALPYLPENGVLKTQLAALWNWMQGDV